MFHCCRSCWTIRHCIALLQTGYTWKIQRLHRSTIWSVEKKYFVIRYFSYCIYVVLLSAQWGGPYGIEAWSLGPLFLQCFDTVGWVYWPIKPVPDMTYNVFGGTLNPAQLIDKILVVSIISYWRNCCSDHAKNSTRCHNKSLQDHQTISV